MTAPLFVDTNVLVYARDNAYSAKRDRAKAVMTSLWSSGWGRLSHQVLVEYYATVTRKLKPGLPREEAMADVRALAVWDPVPPTPKLFERAWLIEGRWQLSWWDSLIVAAALVQNCRTLLTEDLQNGLEIDGLRVVNPFEVEFDLTKLTA